ncbi:MAG: alpha/beta hydrolase [Marinirhabdus sp.]
MQKKKLPLEHNLRPSAQKENAPCIVMLHGYGSDAHDLFSFAAELPAEYCIVSLKAPFKLKPYGNAWYSINFGAADGKFSNDKEAVHSRELVVTCLGAICKAYPIDPTNITLLGFSQGAILSFAVGLSYPEKVKNIIGLSGYINQGILREGYKNNNFKNLSVYSSHGSEDQVIPVAWARKTKPFLGTLNIPCDYSEFPVGHGVAPQNFHGFKTWLGDR